MTPEEKARISRKNGAKSRGPKTDAGKAKSARNALKTGEYADIFKHFVPPHEACVCIEERKDYEALVQDLLAVYNPLNRAATLLVGDIAAARWQIERLKRCITMTWNLALATYGAKPNNFAPELHEVKTMVDATGEVLAGNGVLAKLNREVARLQQSIHRAERQIRFIHANFNAPTAPSGEQTRQSPDSSAENMPVSGDLPETLQNLPPPVYTTEATPSVINAYRKEFPGRPIVILPPDTCDDDENDYRDAPRRAA